MKDSLIGTVVKGFWRHAGYAIYRPKMMARRQLVVHTIKAKEKKKLSISGNIFKKSFRRGLSMP